MTDRTTLDLNECDREPIHVPGLIQSFGHLLACDEKTWAITHASQNVSAMRFDAAAVLGQPLKAVVGTDAFHLLANALAACTAPGVPGRVFDLSVGDQSRFNAAIHTYQGRTVVELEPSSTAYDASAPLTLVRSMLSRMQAAQSVQESCDVAVDQLRALIDFDRVMIYRFLQDGSGTVISESKVEHAASFLGHRYPESDIPKQARALYRKNWIRLIADVNAAPVEVVGRESAPDPLDMTFVGLRSVSPIHLEYLKNMEVEASLSISIVVAGELWGLIACHNASPRVVPPDTRTAAELFGQAFSLQLQTLSRADAAEMLRDARKSIDRIVSELDPALNLVESLEPRLEELATLLGSHGACVLVDGKLGKWGATPPPAEIPRIASWLATSRTGIFASHGLPAIYAPALEFAGSVSGLMALPLSRDSDNYLMFFRREIIRLVNWAGNPDKSVMRSAEGMRLSPRKSFALWQQEVKHQSQIWEPQDRLTAEALRMALLEIVLKYSELVALERTKAENQQRVHAAELNHRVKNALALVGALVAQSKERRGSLRAFVADLEGRIQSLAQAHDLASTQGKLDLRRIFELELKPFHREGDSRVLLKGASVRLADHASSAVTLVVHEMTTNAAKYGALASSLGRLEVTWRRDRSGGCAIAWKERGGPKINRPATTSFGSFLIANQIPFELGGRSNIDFGSDGVEIDLWLPPGSVEWTSGTPRRRQGKPPSDRKEQLIEPILKGKTILLVEDSLIVALETERSLKQFGALAVLVCGSLDQALATASTGAIDVAVLDINLKGNSKSYPIADVLAERRIPFVFVTGYGADVSIPERFLGARVVPKPHSKLALAEEVAATLSRPRA